MPFPLPFRSGQPILLVLFSFFSVLFFTSPALADEPPAVSHQPERLAIASIGLDSPVIAVGWKPIIINGTLYGQWETDDNLVSWHNLSSGLGQVGNIVLAGHSDIYARVFSQLGDIRVGDEIVVFGGEKEFRYIVAYTTLVREKGASVAERIQNARWIAPTSDERLTMVTCARPGATHRLIIVAFPAGHVLSDPLASSDPIPPLQ